MMTSKPVNTDSESDGEIFSAADASHSVEEDLSDEQEVTISMRQDSLNSHPNSLESDKEHEEKETVHIELPEPDAENITVLTHKLPNKPILPWNRYDSPWEESETEQEEKQELSSPPESSNLEQEEETLKPHEDQVEIDEVE